MNRSLALLPAVIVLSAAPLVVFAQTQPSTTQPSTMQPSIQNQSSQPSGASTTNSANPSPSATDTSGQSTMDPMMAEKSPEDVQKIQQALNQNGVRVMVDGKWGPKTSHAVREFQQKNGLHASGKLDSQTLQKLGV